MTVIFISVFFFRLGQTILHRVFRGSNYTFHAQSEQWRNWEDSRHTCTETGSDLVSIESLEEWIFLRNNILSMGTDEYFIGLRKNGKSGKWRWISDNREVTTFHWAKGVNPVVMEIVRLCIKTTGKTMESITT